MKVRITKAEQDTYWYADKIGEVFEVYEDLGSSYYLRYSQGLYSALKKDCEVISEDSNHGQNVLENVHEDKLFQSAVAAMQGLLSAENCTIDMG